MTGSSSSGVANMISGTANKVTNSNGAIVMGAGNSVKDSIASFDTSAYSSLFKSLPKVRAVLPWSSAAPTALKRPRIRKSWAWGTP